MKKIHQINYSKIFSNNFDVERIDDKLTQLQIDEQLRLLDHVIDYVYVNFKELTPRDQNSYKDYESNYKSPSKESRLKGGRQASVQPQSSQS